MTEEYVSIDRLAERLTARAARAGAPALQMGRHGGFHFSAEVARAALGAERGAELIAQLAHDPRIAADWLALHWEGSCWRADTVACRYDAEWAPGPQITVAEAEAIVAELETRAA